MRDKELNGQIAIVTGAGRGIGRGVAMALAREGASVVVNDIYEERCVMVAHEIAALGVPTFWHRADVADWIAVKAMVDRTLAEFGAVDILVNNAGILRPQAPVEEISDDEWDLVLAINVKGAFNCIKAVLPVMKERRHGKIVNVSSIAGRSKSNTGGAHYTTSKAALLGLTRHVAFEAAPYGINVTAIAPAGVDTEMVPEVCPPERLDEVIERIPLGHRLATTEEIANLIIFLASKRSAYITGATIDINGGLLMI